MQCRHRVGLACCAQIRSPESLQPPAPLILLDSAQDSGPGQAERGEGEKLREPGNSGERGKSWKQAGEMAELLGAVLGEDLSSTPSTCVSGSQLPGLSAPGDPMPLASKGTCAHMHTLTQTHTHTHLEVINLLKDENI